LQASILDEFKHNFFVEFKESQVNSFMQQSQEVIVKNNQAYSFGYLIKKDNLYLGVGLDKFKNNPSSYKLKEANITINRDSSWLLLAKYNFYEFENIKLLFGLSLGYQNNNINLDYKHSEIQSLQEIGKEELQIGIIIDDKIKNQCNAGFSGGSIGNNVIYDNTINEYVIIGDGIFCKYFYYIKKEIISNKSRNFMQTSLPISIDFTTMYEVYPNLDLGISLGLTMVEKLNINYNDTTINVIAQNTSSNYIIAFIINFKF
jgi:hypothetical protein